MWTLKSDFLFNLETHGWQCKSCEKNFALKNSLKCHIIEVHWGHIWKQKYVIETKDVLEDKDLITQGFLGLNKIVRSSNSSPGSLWTFSALQIVLCVFPNSKLNLVLRFTLKQRMKKQLSMFCFNVDLRIRFNFEFENTRMTMWILWEKLYFQGIFEVSY